MADNVKQIVRVSQADIPGNRQLVHALTAISGVGYSFSASICNTLKFDQQKKIGTLDDQEIKKIEQVIANPLQFNIPVFMLNRKKDPETGKDIHITVAKLRLTKEFDIKMLKTIKSYKGIRHALGLPLRGQRTRSNFRRGKTVGVSKMRVKKGKKS